MRFYVSKVGHRWCLYRSSAGSKVLGDRQQVSVRDARDMSPAMLHGWFATTLCFERLGQSSLHPCGICSEVDRTAHSPMHRHADC
eukprot:4026507-Amphidinium_carterae.1